MLPDEMVLKDFSEDTIDSQKVEGLPCITEKQLGTYNDRGMKTPNRSK